MPGRDAHIGIAFLMFIIYAVFIYLFSLWDYLFYGAALFFGAILPDILDPWTEENRYNHRGYFHSRRLLKKLYWGLLISFILALVFNWVFYIFFFIIGYISHLWLDSRKPKSWSKGLPA